MRKSIPLLKCWTALIVLLTTWPASAQLTHRYSFTANANDSVGTAHGTAVQLSDANGPIGSPVTFQNGEAALDGVGGYIDLPNGMFSILTNVTIEAWVTVNVNDNWARIFDFGASTSFGEVSPSQAVGTGTNYMFLTPNGAGSSNARFAITDAANGGERPILNDTNPFPVSVQAHVAVAYGPPIARLFVNGQQVAAGEAVVPLSALADVNNWLGRSQWADMLFNGSYNEFRIHDNRRTAQELAASALAGPDTLSYDPGTVTSLTLTVQDTMQEGAVQVPQLQGTFTLAGTIPLGTDDGVVLSSSNTNVVAITTIGQLSARGPGTSTITASLGGQTSAPSTITVLAAPPQLKNRYSFNEAAGATVVVDSVGGQDGNVTPGPSGTNIVLGSGQAVFPGANSFTNAAYIGLPGFLLSTKTNVSIEFWVTWNGPANQNWQRVFDFGSSTKLDGDPRNPGNGIDYLYFSPRKGDANFGSEANGPQAAVTISGSGTLAIGQEEHIVVICAPRSQVFRIYRNGVAVANGTPPAGFDLPALLDPNCWLGVSQWGDPAFNGLLNEFRIHEGLLSGLAVALSRSAGPNALPSASPGILQSLSMATPRDLYPGDTAALLVPFLATFQNAANVEINGVSGVGFTSGDTNIFTVNATGGVLPRNVGNASLIATYQSLSATTTVTVATSTALTVSVPPPLYPRNPAATTSTVLANFPNASNINVRTFTTNYISSNTNIFTVNAQGQVLPQNFGSAELVATYLTLSATTTVTVLQPTALQVNMTNSHIAQGAPLTATLMAAFPGPANINVTGYGGVTRASSDTNVAMIAANGVVLTFNPGTTTLTSTYQGLTNQFALTVVPQPGFVRGQLTHRYSFGGAPDTTAVTDSVGTAHGEVIGLATGTNNNFTGTGQLALGGSLWNAVPLAAHVNLPNGLVSTLSSTTLEGWVNWRGGLANQRFFDFGMSSGFPDGVGGFGEDVVANPGRSYMFLTPSGPRFAINQGTAGENPSIPSSIAIAQNTNTHFAVVYDPPNGVARLYINGRRAGTAAAAQPLSTVDDRNNWLGRSVWQDPLLNGLFDEFRIYNGPLLDTDVAASFAAGPDSIGQPGPTLSAALATGNLEITWPSSATGFVLETVGTLGGTWTSASATLTTNGPTVRAVIPVTGASGFYRLRK